MARNESKQAVFGGLKQLAEGRLSANEWLGWWEQNESAVADCVNRGQFLRIRVLPGNDPDWCALNSQEEACAILEKEGIAFKRSSRYEEEHIEAEAIRAPRSEFDSQVMEFVEEKARGSHDNAFLDRMYRLYQADGEPADVKSWMRKNVTPEFKSVSKRPKWRHEPQWPIIEGKPAVFLKQFDVPENDVTREYYTWDTTVYVFGYRVPINESSYETRHVVVDQGIL